MRQVIGIDPGASGAVARITDGSVTWLADMPETPSMLADLMRTQLASTPVYVERQQAFPKQGGVSNFTTGRGYGRIEGILAMGEFPTHDVSPREWQKVVMKGVKRLPGKEGKAQSVELAERLFPGVKFRGPRGGLMDGRAEACLIAWYGWLQLRPE